MIRRFLIVASIALVVWATIVYVTGGFSVAPLGIRISARSPWRPAILALAGFGAHIAIFGWRQLDEDAAWLIARLRPALVPLVVLAAAAMFVFSIRFGTYVASGADSYGYISQADSWLRGAIRVEQPFVANFPWPFADWTFTPLGYRPAVSGHAIVPIYAPGLPLLMALFKVFLGSNGPYYVVPVSVALSIWICYRLGVALASPLVGATSAILFAASPVFVFQSVWPMSDIPVTLFWSIALLLVARESPRAALAAGLSTSMAAAIRPNLAPVAAILIVYLWWTGRSWLRYALGLLPAALFIAVMNLKLYGAPVAAGYGAIGTLYSLANAGANLDRYMHWLIETQTALVAAGIVSLLRPPGPSPYKWMATVFALAVLAAYLFYAQFDAWWYMRFLLPALPIVLILMCDGWIWLLGFLPRAAQVVVFTVGVVLLLSTYVRFSIEQRVTGFGNGERRYLTAARYVNDSLPPNAILFAMQHSGSVRYYSGRLTIRYDWLDPAWFDRAVAIVRQQGYTPYILLEDWEEPTFKRRFAASEAAQLRRRPIAQFAQSVPVRLYDIPEP